MTPQRITIDTPVRFRDDLPEAVDVVVIGGGVIGVFAGFYLAQAGKRVLICEKGRIAGEQSSRNWGWIRQQGRDPAELPIMMRALRLWHEANDRTGGRCGVRTCGVWYLASDVEGMAENEAWLNVARDHDLDTRLVGPGEVRDAFSGAAARDWAGGILTPSDARGEPWQAVPAVAGLAQEEGALIRENCAVRGLDIVAGRVRGVETEDGPVRCEQVVMAGGAWSSLFLRRHGISIPQLSVRGTVARTTPIDGFFDGCATDEDLALRRREDGGYTLAPAFGHGFYLGPDAFRHARKYMPVLRDSWREIRLRLAAPAGFPDAWGTPRGWPGTDVTPFEVLRVLEPAPDHGEVGRLRDLFADRFPQAGRPDIATAWAGMIDTMPDVVPVVDRADSPEGLIIATGMCGHGFGIGPGFGQVVARMAMGQAAEFDLSRFRLSRFTDGSRMEIGPAL